MRRVLAALGTLLLFACEGSIDPILPLRRDAGPVDAAPARDGGDVVPRDGGDEGERDGGVAERDGGEDPRDAGPMPRDGGPRDDGPRDAGPSALPVCAQDLTTALAMLRNASPNAGSNGYVAMGLSRRTAVGEVVEAVLAGNDDLAAAALSDAAYQACRMPTDEVLLTATAAGEGGALALIRPHATRRIVVEVPHPRVQPATVQVGSALFDSVDALALIVSGTHRCANDAPSGCQGDQQICSAMPEPFRESDMGHAVRSAYQAFHQALVDQVATSTTVTLDGRGGAETVVSNGTQNPTAVDGLTARVVGALEAAYPGNTFWTCNPFAGGTTSVVLCATENVQGRYSNQVAMPCTTPATAATDRFLHVQLSPAVGSDPEALAAALRAALP